MEVLVIIPTYAASSIKGYFPNQKAVEAYCGDATKASLDSDTAWCASNTLSANVVLGDFIEDPFGKPMLDQRQWLQLDAGSLIILAGIQTKGRYDANEWVTSYTVSVAMDGVNFVPYEENGVKHHFSANFDRDTIVNNGLGTGLVEIRARSLRIFPETWHRAMAMRAGLLGCMDYAKISLPMSPALTTPTMLGGDPLALDFEAGIVGPSHMRPLKACYATRRSEGDSAFDFVTLDNIVNIIPEPSDPMIVMEYPRGEITSVTFVKGGDSMPGLEGDFFALTQDPKCTNLRAVPTISIAQGPFGPSGLITLKANQTVDKYAVMKAKLNELNSGTYRLCYATKESKGDTDRDFRAIKAVVEIFIDERAPALSVSPNVVLGQDIVIGWKSSNGYDTRRSSDNDWIALYHKGHCPQVDYYNDRARKGLIEEEVSEEYRKNAQQQNQCYLAQQALQKDVDGGEVRFSAHQYGDIVGEFEVRYFNGDSISTGGYVCRGLQQSTGGEVRICALESTVVSDVIKVEAALAESSYQHMSAQEHMPQAFEQKIPGLEAVCMGPECGDV